MDGKEWEVKIKELSLENRTPDELKIIGASASAKRARVTKDLQEIQLFPDAKKKEIYDHLVRVGEIIEESVGAISLSPVNQEKVDEEYQSQVDHYTIKIARLGEFVTVCDEAILWQPIT
ncbi:MAG: hypothetical protein KAS32_05180 [Candidatus Peribacteraceae bacterium]|nr:hypothetical protein [Candidatus Peribacteraceae bacterium]